MALRLRLWQARLLRACVSDSTGESARALLQRAPRDVLATLPLVASFHRVVGHVNKALGGVVPAAVRASLARLQMDEVARKVLARENLRRSDHLLRELEIPFLVVKGPILSAVIYDDPRVRFYRDLDLIVPAASFARALEAFERTGAHVVDTNWSYFLEHVAGQIDLSSNVDLHWHLLFFERLRQVTRVRMEDVFERARTVSVDGVSVRTLDPVDTLIHLALHACLAGGGRLCWLKDIEQVVVNDHPEWTDVVARSREWRVNLFVGTMLLRSRDMLGTPVEDDVLRRLIPSSAWRGFLRSVDWAFPVTAWTRRVTPAIRIAERMQPTVTGTFGELGSAAARRTRALVSSKGDFDETSDANARQLFLEQVAKAS